MKKKPGVMGVIGIVLGVIALIASFFVAGEDNYPGRFFIERQAYWNGGTYYVKYTFLSVLLTLCDLFAIPMIIIAGLGALMRSRSEDPPAPMGWDTSQTGRRMKFIVFVLVATPLWLAYTGAAILAPDVLKPAGFLASILLIFVPLVPMAIPAFTFEALVAPRYVEGQLESIQIVTNKNASTAHLYIGGEEFQTQPVMVAGLTQGQKVGLVVSGFFKAVLRAERRG